MACLNPVLFLVFNRLDTAARVFAEIRKACPPRLYIASDGPRPDKDGEAQRVEAVRRYILDRVDWPCEVQTLFREKNLGCRLAVSEGISWFFSCEPMGMVLEDDCLPAPDFFRFCDDMLVRYADQDEVMAISGSNILGYHCRESDYFASDMGGIWGWASWRRAWAHYKVDVTADFTEESWKSIGARLNNATLTRTLREIMQKDLIDKTPSTWDYQWLFIRMLHGGITLVPNVNLISNIGFNVESTHTADDAHPLSELPCGNLPTEIRHPVKIKVEKKFDAGYQKYFRTPLIGKVIKRLRRVFHVR